MVIKTISLKLHKPSARKQRIIEDAVLRYSTAFAYLLKRLEEKLGGIRVPVTKFALLQQIDKALLGELNAFGVQPFKDALKLDAAITLRTYFGRAQAGKKAAYPLSFLDDHAFGERFDALCDAFQSGKDFLEEYDRLLNKYAMQRPLLFCRHDASRDYSLLYDKEKDRFYAKLYLLNARSPLKPPPGDGAAVSALYYLGKDGRRLEQNVRARRYIIVPLSFGKWQEEYLKGALADPGSLKTAQLVCKNSGYYLNIKVACKEKPPLPVSSYMGVVRSLHGYLSYGIHEHERNELACGNIFGREDAYSKQTVDEALLHRLANEAVRLALAHNSQLVLYALGRKNDMLGHEDAAPVLSMGQYNRLAAFISYKAVLKGLAKPVTVSPTHVFHTCPVCSTNSIKNRMNADLFLCTSCGYIRDVEQLGSRNLALMVRTYSKSRVVFKTSKLGDTVKYTNLVLDFEFVSSRDQYANERFFDYLHEYIGGITPGAVPKKKRSVLKKLAQLDNLKDGVELVES